MRVAGGLLVGSVAWRLLRDQDGSAETKPRPSGAIMELAVVPLTIPLTVGPATISVMVAYGSSYPLGRLFDGGFLAGIVVASVCASLTVWVCYHYAERIARWLGPVGERTAQRLFGFLLLCLAAQMPLTGASKVFETQAH